MSVPLKSPGMRRSVVIALAAVLALLLVFGVTQLFSLRFARGDIYPPYSSLRTDPLGSKVLADALGRMPGFTVERSYRELSRLKVPQPATVVYLGISFRAPVDEKEFAEAERMVARGSRLIITFIPELKRTGNTRIASRKKPGTPAPGATPSPSRRRSGQADDSPEFREAAERWGVSFDLAQDEDRSVKTGVAEPAEDQSDLETKVPWHTALYFKGLDPKWRIICNSNNVPVIIERSYGQGSIVLCADSYFLSNEGLHAERAPRLISRVIGPPQTVVFDELHHGVAENPNIAGLIRRHGLGGVILSLFGVALLFIWKNAVPLLPPREAARDSTDVVGLDSNAGFINLLRRGVAPGRLLATCVEAWLKSGGQRAREEERAHVESVLRAHASRSARDAAAAYRTIVDGLTRR